MFIYKNVFMFTLRLVYGNAPLGNGNLVLSTINVN